MMREGLTLEKNVGKKDMVLDDLLRGTGYDGQLPTEADGLARVKKWVISTCDLVLEMKDLFPEGVISRSKTIIVTTGKTASNSFAFTRKQVACLVASGVMTLLANGEYKNSFEFGVLMERTNGRMFGGVVHYLQRFYDGEDETKPDLRKLQGYVQVQRVANDFNIFDPKLRALPLCKVCIHDRKIDAFRNRTSLADFANKYIGGGCLGSRGSVQEELMFGIVSPELLLSHLLERKFAMTDTEVIAIRGTEMFSNNSGYAGTANWEKGVNDTGTPRCSDGSVDSLVLTMDATSLKSVGFERLIGQFLVNEEDSLFNRDLKKACIAFGVDRTRNVSTGLWGCGDFKNNMGIKFLQQWLACSMTADTPERVMYFSVMSKNDRPTISAVLKQIEKYNINTVGDMLDYIAAYGEFLKANMYSVDFTKTTICYYDPLVGQCRCNEEEEWTPLSSVLGKNWLAPGTTGRFTVSPEH